MDYKKILKDAYKITIKNKLLWLFGFFVGGAGTGFSYSSGYDFGNSDLQNSEIADKLENYWPIIAIIILIFIGCALISLVISFIAQGGFYHGVDLASEQKKLSFKQLVKFGWQHFFRLVGLCLLIGLLFCVGIIGLMIPLGLLLLIPILGWIIAIFLAIIEILVLIVAACALGVFTQYAICFLLLNNKGIIEALQAGYGLLRKNLKDSAIIFGLQLVIGIILSAISLAAMVLVFLPFILIGISIYPLLGWLGVGLIAALGILVALAILLPWRAVVNTFTNSVWILTWKEITK